MRQQIRLLTMLFFFVFKTFYYSCLIKELDNSDNGNSSGTCQRTNLSKSEILINHRSVLSSFCVNTKDDDIDLPSLYLIPKRHKDSYKQRFIAVSSSCPTKPLFKLLTSILTTAKEGVKKYCDVIYSHSGINQMWILKSFKELLDNLQSHLLTSIHSIKIYEFSTLYISIPHTKLKARLSELIKNVFRCKNGKSATNILWSAIHLHTLLIRTIYRGRHC